MGYNVQRTLESDIELTKAYEIYLACREQQIVVYEESKGKSNVQRVKPFVTGWSVLPCEGGLLDQPHILMSLLEIFMSGERDGFYLK